ncbi:LysR family transcriptional regulator [Apilactobacillus xinyiensis]|uniref:LysR family transcriptional regulator n=1 Tax=Apilactobacillus xinyiensis TaxID=2841032 RepID=UPI0020100268|nr:LysR family transcriptional regulator [Apilactobacillus xinyiensis]MCL0329761.1 LysR family transcriptional regulator [Apilactobacillus xinyiensis]
MNTKDLAYFTCLVEIKNFSKVAERFKVQQPTITTAIKRLEKEFSTTLFIRDRKHNTLEITTSGQQLFQRSQIILNELTLAQKEIDRINREQLVLGLPPIIENHYFSKICQKLSDAQILNRLTTVEAGSVSLTQAIHEGTIDLSLLGSITPIKDDDLIASEIERQPFCIYVSNKHPLAKYDQIRFKTLVNENFVFFKQNFIHNQAFTQLSQQNNFHPKIIFKSNDLNMLMKLINQNLGIGFFTRIVNTDAYDIKKLNLLDANAPQFITSLVYRRHQFLTPSQIQLINVLKNNL